jgi:hypothetical protein
MECLFADLLAVYAENYRNDTNTEAKCKLFQCKRMLRSCYCVSDDDNRSLMSRQQDLDTATPNVRDCAMRDYVFALAQCLLLTDGSQRHFNYNTCN